MHWPPATGHSNGSTSPVDRTRRGRRKRFVDGTRRRPNRTATGTRRKMERRIQTTHTARAAKRIAGIDRQRRRQRLRHVDPDVAVVERPRTRAHVQRARPGELHGNRDALATGDRAFERIDLAREVAGGRRRERLVDRARRRPDRTTARTRRKMERRIQTADTARAAERIAGIDRERRGQRLGCVEQDVAVIERRRAGRGGPDARAGELHRNRDALPTRNRALERVDLTRRPARRRRRERLVDRAGRRSNRAATRPRRKMERRIQTTDTARAAERIAGIDRQRRRQRHRRVDRHRPKVERRRTRPRGLHTDAGELHGDRDTLPARHGALERIDLTRRPARRRRAERLVDRARRRPDRTAARTRRKMERRIQPADTARAAERIAGIDRQRRRQRHRRVDRHRPKVERRRRRSTCVRVRRADQHERRNGQKQAESAQIPHVAAPPRQPYPKRIRTGRAHHCQGVAPGGVEPPHADSKSAALSTELRGRVGRVKRSPATTREPRRRTSASDTRGTASRRSSSPRLVAASPAAGTCASYGAASDA